MHVHVCEIAVGRGRGRGRGCDIDEGAESALAGGARVDMAADGDRAARRETDVAGATGAAESPVRCYCRRCQLHRGNASFGTGMTFQTLSENPCARAERDV